MKHIETMKSLGRSYGAPGKTIQPIVEICGDLNRKQMCLVKYGKLVEFPGADVPRTMIIDSLKRLVMKGAWPMAKSMRKLIPIILAVLKPWMPFEMTPYNF